MSQLKFGSLKRLSSASPLTEQSLVSAHILLDEIKGPSAPKIIDVSSPGDFERLHIPGATNIPLVWDYRCLETNGGISSMALALKDAMQTVGISGTQQIVFTEQSPAAGYGRSARGLFICEALGIDPNQLRVLDGGNLQWRRAGGEVTKGEASTKECNDWKILNQNPSSHILTLAETLELLRHGVTFLDVRNEAEFFGHGGAPYQVIEGNPPLEVVIEPGRIPNAIGMPWTDVFEMQGERLSCFRSPGALEELFKASGLKRDEPIVVYCFKGARASAVLLALHLAGFSQSMMYFNGWNEWSRLDDTPKETDLPSLRQRQGSYQGVI